MAENKMAEVAKLFGKELGKRFTVNFYNRLYDVSFDNTDSEYLVMKYLKMN